MIHAVNRTWAPPVVRRNGVAIEWTGPTDDDLAQDGVTLVRHVPYERWPYGGPNAHEACCNLFDVSSVVGGLYCDCDASDADDHGGIAP